MPEAELSLLFLRPLNRLKIRYIVSGSVASILYGEPRFTNDLDLVVVLQPDDIRRLIEAFPAPDFHVPPEETIATEMERTQKGQFNLIHSGTGFKADFYTAGRDEFNAWAFRNARKMDFMDEVVMVAPRNVSLSASWNLSGKAVRKNICATSAPCLRCPASKSTGRI